MLGKHSKHLLAKEEKKKHGIDVFDFHYIEIKNLIQVTDLLQPAGSVHLKNRNLISKNHYYIQNYSTSLFCLYMCMSTTPWP